MGDFLVELGANKQARQAIKKLGLPIPMPQRLKRTKGSWEERPLADLPVVVCHGEGSVFASVLAQILPRTGANTTVIGNDKQMAIYKEVGEAWARLPSSTLPDKTKPHSLIFDATGMSGPQDLKAVYEFLHDRIRNVRPSGRVILLSRPPASLADPSAAAAARALDGLNRSLSREIGKKGTTSQLITIDDGAEDRLEPVLRFLLSTRSAYITAQPIHLSKGTILPERLPVRQPLEHKVALVTGAARGIGAAIARGMAREGAHVICMDRPSEADEASVLAEQIKGTVLLTDITDENAFKEIEALLKDKFGGHLDILVHNAGITRDKTLANMKPEAWDMTLNVNLISLMHLNQALMPLISSGGRIVCLSSVTGIAGNMGQTNYATSKAGLIGYVQSLAQSLKDKSVTINAVAPGFIETKMTAGMPRATREVARRLCNLVQGGLPEDIAETVTFLASPGAAGLNGEVIRICGGSYIGA